MLVVEARHMGMCFGVKDALAMMRDLPEPERVTVYGELVHNPVVIDEIRNRGFHQQSEQVRSLKPDTPDVLITAHGVSNAVKEQLIEDGYQVHDTTCPLVRRAHKAALHYHNKGYFLLIIGRRGHVEVNGLSGDLSNFQVISGPEEIQQYPHPKMAVINQTTTRPDQLAKLHETIRLRNPGKEVVLVDTTCQPTKDRQEAVADLIKRVQGLVVVGGPNSNNTRQLGLRAQESGIPWWRVSTASELQESWFQGLRIVGLTAGTSTTDETIREVARCLRTFAAKRLTA
jgi:4-hydroxy-3-methylbut-2-en-1-yl diphosphate reductase